MQVTSPLTRIAASTAAELIPHCELGDEARALVTAGQSPAALLTVLTEQAQWADAIRFLSQGLPARVAVWWACRCVRAAVPEGNPELLQAVESWVGEPSDERRRAAFAMAEASGLDSPAACAALAAFLSAGSLGPANLPELRPAPHLAGRAVSGALLLAAVVREAEQAPQKLQRFVEIGLEIASGGQLPFEK